MRKHYSWDMPDGSVRYMAMKKHYSRDMQDGSVRYMAIYEEDAGWLCPVHGYEEAL